MSTNETPKSPNGDQSTQDAPGVRRGRTTGRFHSRVVPESEGVIVGRDLLKSQRGDRKPQTSRERAIAGDLPGWQPMPPGELHVRRPRQ